MGVYNISERETQRVVEDAISAGYRSIDTAAMYYNEKGVGDAVDDAKVMPVVNQCETHVLYQQRKMLEYLKPYNVALEAWSPLAEGRHGIRKEWLRTSNSLTLRCQMRISVKSACLIQAEM